MVSQQQSPYLNQFLLEQAFPQVAASKRATTAGKRPAKISGSIFNGIPRRVDSAYRMNDLTSNAMQSARAYADVRHSNRMNQILATKQAAANAKAQKDYLAKLQKLMRQNGGTTPTPNGYVPNPYVPSPYTPDPNVNVPVLPLIPTPEESAQNKWNEMNKWACKTYGVCK